MPEKKITLRMRGGFPRLGLFPMARSPMTQTTDSRTRFLPCNASSSCRSSPTESLENAQRLLLNGDLQPELIHCSRAAVSCGHGVFSEPDPLSHTFYGGRLWIWEKDYGPIAQVFRADYRGCPVHQLPLDLRPHRFVSVTRDYDAP